ncbi:unnamed protein product [Schistosoma rodhaini]|uniref:Uncharacterized protein n=1 Tax=Schistosoma rodhaini TaxID=6188 RepID=A0AA85G6C4_9TREM|nr:unnamed protein product [Schistosoma rodhaini]
MDSNVVDLEGTNECNNISKRIKIILVGNSNVGKSSLLRSFIQGSDENEPISTVGTDLKLYEMRINNELVKLYIWDTAGTERFRNHMCPSYFRHAEGALVVYDVGCQKSFEELNMWIKMIAQHSGSRLVKVIIGNKNDLPARAVNVQKAEEYAKSINCAYLETSAKTGMNVRQAFITLARLIIEKNAQQLNTIKENNVVLREKSKKQVQCCHH